MFDLVMALKLGFITLCTELVFNIYSTVRFLSPFRRRRQLQIMLLPLEKVVYVVLCLTPNSLLPFC